MAIRLVWTCDNEASIYFDSEEVDHSSNWHTIKDRTLEVGVPSEVVVEAVNTGGPAFLALFLEVDGERWLQTDESWTWDGNPVFVLPEPYGGWAEEDKWSYFHERGVDFIWSTEAAAKGEQGVNTWFTFRKTTPWGQYKPAVIGLEAVGTSMIGGGIAKKNKPVAIAGGILDVIGGIVAGSSRKTW